MLLPPLCCVYSPQVGDLHQYLHQTAFQQAAQGQLSVNTDYAILISGCKVGEGCVCVCVFLYIRAGARVVRWRGSCSCSVDNVRDQQPLPSDAYTCTSIPQGSCGCFLFVGILLRSCSPSILPCPALTGCTSCCFYIVIKLLMLFARCHKVTQNATGSHRMPQCDKDVVGAHRCHRSAT